MKTFTTARQGGRFRIINLKNINYVDFVSLDENPEPPERCTIYFNASDKSLSLENPADVQALLRMLTTGE